MGSRLDRRGIVELEIKGVVFFFRRLVVDLEFGDLGIFIGIVVEIPQSVRTDVVLPVRLQLREPEHVNPRFDSIGGGVRAEGHTNQWAKPAAFREGSPEESLANNFASGERRATAALPRREAGAAWRFCVFNARSRALVRAVRRQIRTHPSGFVLLRRPSVWRVMAGRVTGTARTSGVARRNFSSENLPRGAHQRGWNRNGPTGFQLRVSECGPRLPGGMSETLRLNS